MLLLNFSTHCEGYKATKATKTKSTPKLKRKNLKIDVSHMISCFSDIFSSMNDMEIEKK